MVYLASRASSLSATRGRAQIAGLNWPVLAAAITIVFMLAGCTEVVEWFDSPNYPRNRADDGSDLDYCDQIARAILHAEGEISQDIGHEFETGHASQGPDTLERNMAAEQERRHFHQIVAECLRQRRAARASGSSR